MKHAALLLIAIGAILLFGCIQPPGGASATDKPIGEIVKEDVATPTSHATVTPIATASAAAPAKASANPAEAITGDITAATPNAAPASQQASTETDDNGWYPNSITVKANVPLIIHNKERTENVYFAGGQIRGDALAEPVDFKVGEQKDLTFTPTTSTCLGNYWPSSGVLKGFLKVNVEGQAQAQC